MALRGTLTHRKTRKLATLLGIEVPCALGLIEALWHVTAEQTPTGNIGRLSNQDIAMEMFYTGDADALVNAFVDAGWLDLDDLHRLITHDWSIYADDATDARVARNHSAVYADGKPARMKRLSKEERAKIVSHNTHENDPGPQRGTQSHKKPLPVSVPDSDSDSDSDSVSDSDPEPASHCSSQPTGTLVGTEGWEETVQLAEKAGMSLDPSPFSDLCQKFWRWLNLQDKQAAMNGIASRLECGQYSDPSFVPTFENYLRKKRWNESLRPKPNISTMPSGSYDKLAHLRKRHAEALAREGRAS